MTLLTIPDIRKSDSSGCMEGWIYFDPGAFDRNRVSFWVFWGIVYWICVVPLLHCISFTSTSISLWMAILSDIFHHKGWEIVFLPREHPTQIFRNLISTGNYPLIASRRRWCNLLQCWTSTMVSAFLVAFVQMNKASCACLIHSAQDLVHTARPLYYPIL